MTEKSIEQVLVSAAFRKLMEESKDRLARTAALRERVQRQIEVGITPSGPYAEFVERTSRDIFVLLCAAAERFNQENPTLMCPASAFLDALGTTRERLLHGAAQMKSVLAPIEGVRDG